MSGLSGRERCSSMREALSSNLSLDCPFQDALHLSFTNFRVRKRIFMIITFYTNVCNCVTVISIRIDQSRDQLVF